MVQATARKSPSVIVLLCQFLPYLSTTPHNNMIICEGEQEEGLETYFAFM
jgi:hypothetical protein